MWGVEGEEGCVQRERNWSSQAAVGDGWTIDEEIARLAGLVLLMKGNGANGARVCRGSVLSLALGEGGAKTDRRGPGLGSLETDCLLLLLAHALRALSVLLGGEEKRGGENDGFAGETSAGGRKQL